MKSNFGKELFKKKRYVQTRKTCETLATDAMRKQ